MPTPSPKEGPQIQQWQSPLVKALESLQLVPLRVQFYGRGTYPCPQHCRVARPPDADVSPRAAHERRRGAVQGLRRLPARDHRDDGPNHDPARSVRVDGRDRALGARLTRRSAATAAGFASAPRRPRSSPSRVRSGPWGPNVKVVIEAVGHATRSRKRAIGTPSKAQAMIRIVALQGWKTRTSPA